MDAHAVSKIVFRDIGVISQQESGRGSEPRTHGDDTDTNTSDATEAGPRDIETFPLKDLVRMERSEGLEFPISTV
jgi:hypothetical protein